MRVIALDLATKTGVASDDPDRPGVPRFGTLVLGKGDDTHGDKGLVLERFLEKAIATAKPDALVYEQPSDPSFYGETRSDIISPLLHQAKSIATMHDVLPLIRTLEAASAQNVRRFTNFSTLRTLIGVAFLVDVIGKRHGIEVYEVPVQSWRSWFTGTIKAPVGHHIKQPAFDRCHKLGWMTRGYDESDSCGLWAFTRAKLDPSFPVKGFREDIDNTPLFGGR